MTLRKHLPTIAIAIVTAAVTAAGPSMAAAAFDALNADKVDGKHAVGAGASVNKRKGKLVATGTNGRLPNNIIAKAPDADKLDGKDSTAFLLAGAQAYAYVDMDGPVLVPEKTKNVVSVTRPTTGNYCLLLADGISDERFAVAVAEFGRSAGDELEVYIDYGACDPGSLGVVTEQASVASNDVAFLVLIP